MYHFVDDTRRLRSSDSEPIRLDSLSKSDNCQAGKYEAAVWKDAWSGVTLVSWTVTHTDGPTALTCSGTFGLHFNWRTGTCNHVFSYKSKMHQTNFYLTIQGNMAVWFMCRKFWMQMPSSSLTTSLFSDFHRLLLTHISNDFLSFFTG